MAKTVGKQFEADFAASIPDDVYFQRIKDPAQSFGGSGNTSFSPSNPYDCYMYSCPTFFALELKTADKAMSFWREKSEQNALRNPLALDVGSRSAHNNFNRGMHGDSLPMLSPLGAIEQEAPAFRHGVHHNDPLKHTYNIKRNQIEALQKASKHKGVIAGFVLNFRSEDKTYFLEINKFLDLVNSIDKKSINQMDVSSCGLLIRQKKLKVHYRYDIKRFIEEVVADKGR